VRYSDYENEDDGDSVVIGMNRTNRKEVKEQKRKRKKREEKSTR